MGERSCSLDEVSIEMEPTASAGALLWRRVVNLFHNRETVFDQFLEYIRTNNILEIEKACTYDHNVLSCLKHGKNALHWACGDYAASVTKRTVQKLLSLGADPFFTTPDLKNCNSLHFAALFSSADVLDYMIEYVAKVDRRKISDKTLNGDTALLLLLTNRNDENQFLSCAKKLFEYGFDLYLGDETQISLVIRAAGKQYKNFLKYLFQNSLVLIDLDSLVIRNKNAREWLVEKEIFARDELPSPIGEKLFGLLQNDKDREVKKFKNLKKYCNVALGGKTLLYLALENEQWETAEYLVQIGADVMKGSDISRRDGRRNDDLVTGNESSRAGVSKSPRNERNKNENTRSGGFRNDRPKSVEFKTEGLRSGGSRNDISKLGPEKFGKQGSRKDLSTGENEDYKNKSPKHEERLKRGETKNNETDTKCEDFKQSSNRNEGGNKNEDPKKGSNEYALPQIISETPLELSLRKGFFLIASSNIPQLQIIDSKKLAEIALYIFRQRLKDDETKYINCRKCLEIIINEILYFESIDCWYLFKDTPIFYLYAANIDFAKRPHFLSYLIDEFVDTEDVEAYFDSCIIENEAEKVVVFDYKPIMPDLNSEVKMLAYIGSTKEIRSSLDHILISVLLHFNPLHAKILDVFNCINTFCIFLLLLSTILNYNRAYLPYLFYVQLFIKSAITIYTAFKYICTLNIVLEVLLAVILSQMQMNTPLSLTCAILILGINLFIAIGRISGMYIYALMLKNIAFKFFKLFCWYGIIILIFSITFHIMFDEYNMSKGILEFKGACERTSCKEESPPSDICAAIFENNDNYNDRRKICSKKLGEHLDITSQFVEACLFMKHEAVGNSNHSTCRKILESTAFNWDLQIHYLERYNFNKSGLRELPVIPVCDYNTVEIDSCARRKLIEERKGVDAYCDLANNITYLEPSCSKFKFENFSIAVIDVSCSEHYCLRDVSHYGLWLYKSLVMLTGENEFEEKNFEKYPSISRVIHFLYIITTVIVLMNLLNGLAVADIQDVVRNASIQSIVKKIEMRRYGERFFRLSYNHFKDNTYILHKKNCNISIGEKIISLDYNYFYYMRFNRPIRNFYSKILSRLRMMKKGQKYESAF